MKKFCLLIVLITMCSQSPTSIEQKQKSDTTIVTYDSISTTPILILASDSTYERTLKIFNNTFQSGQQITCYTCNDSNVYIKAEVVAYQVQDSVLTIAITESTASLKGMIFGCWRIK